MVPLARPHPGPTIRGSSFDLLGPPSDALTPPWDFPGPAPWSRPERCDPVLAALSPDAKADREHLAMPAADARAVLGPRSLVLVLFSEAVERSESFRASLFET